MKGTEHFKDVIQNYLETRASCKGGGNVLVTLLCPKLVQTRLFEVLRRKAQKSELTDSQIIHAISPFLEPWG